MTLPENPARSEEKLASAQIRLPALGAAEPRPAAGALARGLASLQPRAGLHRVQKTRGRGGLMTQNNNFDIAPAGALGENTSDTEPVGICCQQPMSLNMNDRGIRLYCV